MPHARPGADAAAKVLVEARGPTLPVRGHLFA